MRLGEALQKWLQSADTRGGYSQARAVSAWDEVAGEEISRHTAGLGMRKGELVVHVDSHAWATQLSLMSDDLRRRMNSVLGEELVNRIRFTVSRAVEDEREIARQVRDSSRRYGGERVESAALTPDELAEVEEQASPVKNGQLKEAAIRAQVAFLEWQKGQESQERRDEPPRVAKGHDEEQIP